MQQSEIAQVERLQQTRRTPDRSQSCEIHPKRANGGSARQPRHPVAQVALLAAVNDCLAEQRGGIASAAHLG
jgi:hypothetical protein